jgi:hypothetical protein
MQTDSQSILEWLGLPPNFGYALLIIGLVLSLSPYLGGSDFGVVKIPDFNTQVRNTLKMLGPTVMLGAILVHVKFLPMRGPDENIVVAPEPTDPVAENTSGRGAVEKMPSQVGVISLDPGSVVLAPFDGGQCLYAATVVGGSGAAVTLWFSFGKDGSAPEARLRNPPVSPLENPAPGSAVFARLANNETWAPGIIKEIRSGRALSDLEPATDCAGKYGKSYLWADLDEATLIKREK